MAQGRLHGHAGRHPVVDDDHGAARGVDRRPQARVLAPALLDGGQLARGCRGDVVLGQVERAHQRVVEHDLGLVAVGDGADRELRLSRRADLAHEGDVERGAKRARDLGRHRHAAARQGEHEGVLQSHGGEPLGQQPAGLGPVRESYSSAHGGAGRNVSGFPGIPPTTHGRPHRRQSSASSWLPSCVWGEEGCQPFLPSFLSPLSSSAGTSAAASSATKACACRTQSSFSIRPSRVRISSTLAMSSSEKLAI